MKSGGAVGVSQTQCSSWTLGSVTSVASGVQFSWALQLSLLTPYIQGLGVPHSFSSLIWVYGAITGIVVQPVLGFRSDRCTSRFGRRRPFIVAGAAIASVGLMLIGFAKDIGYKAGDSLTGPTKPRAIVVSFLGFWLLDVGNNTIQGPSRALIADLCFNDHEAMRKAMSRFSFFLAIGNVLGYFIGSSDRLRHLVPFTKTEACEKNCTNVKFCFLLAMVLLLILTLNAIASVSELQLNEELVHSLSVGQQPQTMSWWWQLTSVFHSLKRPMWLLLLVTSLNWLGLFPIMLFGTDWVGREVFKGNAMSGDEVVVVRYEVGVRVGAFGLMVNSVVVALASLGMEKMGYLMGGVKRLWGVGNLILAGGLILTVMISKSAETWWRGQPVDTQELLFPMHIMAAAWAVFAVLGISIAVTYSIPFAMASIYCSIYGGGQGLLLAVLNLSIVIPQMIVAILAGQVDEVFGGGNLPSFVIASVFAAISAFLAFFVLPDPFEQPGFLPSTKRGYSRGI
ncbi:hypothetical protein ACOSP7_009397 [Xanthoceras sorbifolium]|uniref:Sucrose transporter n=1 Tax=Xanthoceras sorbifolium TaxID=99658 RepID=A0ABQ8HV30_9ROSI|nr:hypothetical protein JRO89_XS07G0249300 [Xanthoceras sorbifolium]